MTKETQTTEQWYLKLSENEKKAVQLYTVLAFDIGDFREMLEKESVKTLQVLYEMLTNNEYENINIGLNKTGSSLVLKEIKRRREQ